MSDSSTAKRPSRMKVWLPFTAGEPLGRPFAEWGYRTPRFPQGIKRSDLAAQPSEVQRETMSVWFLANHVPATGPYFGVDSPDPNSNTGAYNTAAFNEAPFNGLPIAGFGEGRWFRGGRAGDLLKAEFADMMSEPLLTEMAAFFDGLWELVTNEEVVDLTLETPEQRTSTIVAALDDFADAVLKLAPEHGGIGHNRPPDDVPAITEDERYTILRATAETRLAVLSADYSAANAAWQAVSPIIKMLGSDIAKQIDNYLTKFTGTLGVGTAVVATGYIGSILGLWNKAEAISAMLELAKHLLH